MPAEELDITAIIFDVGSCTKSEENECKEFFSKAKNCVIKILVRKICSQSNEQLSVVVAGSKKTDNVLADDDDNYQNIEVLSTFAKARWDSINKVLNIQSTDITNTWLNALVVGIECLKEKLEELDNYKKMKKKVNKKRIILLSRFIEDSISADQSVIDDVISDLKNKEIDLIVFGPDIFTKSSDENSSSHLKENFTLSQRLIIKIFDEVSSSGEALLGTVEEALENLKFFESKRKRRQPWSVDMFINSEITIPITGFKMYNDDSQPVNWASDTANKYFSDDVNNEAETKSEGDDKSKIFSDNEPGLKHDEKFDFNGDLSKLNPVQLAGETNEQSHANVVSDNAYFLGEKRVESSDIVSGYSFGSDVIPCSADDEEAFRYRSGCRGLFILFTVETEKIEQYLVMGDSPMHIIGNKSDTESQERLATFVKVLHEEDKVAIARKVYRADSNPVIGVLFPKIDAEPPALIFLEFPFKEEIIKLWFPSLRHVTVTDEQMEAVDNLIDSMDLTVEDEDDEELYVPESLLDPHDQNTFHNIVLRAFRGKGHDSGSFEIPEHIKNLINPSSKIVNKSKSALELIKSVFPLEVIERKNSGKSDDEDDNDDAVENDENQSTSKNIESGLDDTKTISDYFLSSVVTIGTVDPENDFKKLLARGDPFEKVCENLKKVVIELLRRADNLEMLKKPLVSLGALRLSCIERQSPNTYNNCINQVKETIIDLQQSDFWDKIVEEKLGLITSEETGLSDVTKEQSEDFMKFERNVKQELSADEQMDIDNFLDFV